MISSFLPDGIFNYFGVIAVACSREDVSIVDQIALEEGACGVLWINSKVPLMTAIHMGEHARLTDVILNVYRHAGGDDLRVLSIWSSHAEFPDVTLRKVDGFFFACKQIEPLREAAPAKEATP